jgi:hypothetical protein
MKSSIRIAGCLFSLLLFSVLPAHADQQRDIARPGTVNYVEGQVTLANENLAAASIGKTEVDPGQTLNTENGKAEILLTPGVFLRLGPAGSARMISNGLTNTAMSVERGEAFVEVDEIHSENDLRILEDGIPTQLMKAGLYNFNANLHVVRVMEGEAIVFDGNHEVRVKGGHMVDLTTGEPLKVRKFDKREIEAEDLYRWTSLRSAYIAEANVDYAPVYAYGGLGWYGGGWYWDPWFSAYTFLPGDGIFYSPFGWGFYSPWCVFGAPFFWGGHYYHYFSPTAVGTWGHDAHYAMPKNYGHGVQYAAHYSPHGSFGGYRGGLRGGFQGAVAGFRGGGFHGGFGGFHGGGFGGGGGGHR